MFLTISSLSIERCVFRTLFVNFELRDHSGDVGHHLLVQDAPSFIHKYMILIHWWSVFAFVYISEKFLFLIDFHGLAFPGFSRAHHDVRFEKSVPIAPISSSFIASCCLHIWSKVCSVHVWQFLPPGISWKKQKKTDRVACEYLDTRFLERIPSCSPSTSTSASACLRTMRSTTGVALAVEGPNARMVAQGVTKRQTAVSHSTPDSEIVAADYAMRAEGMPALTLMETILERKVNLCMMEDNEAMIRICHSGKNPTMRCLNCARNVGVSWPMEVFGLPNINIYKIDTRLQAADIGTKMITCLNTWKSNYPDQPRRT
jgi:hypothetical protein